MRHIEGPQSSRECRKREMFFRGGGRNLYHGGHRGTRGKPDFDDFRLSPYKKVFFNPNGCDGVAEAML